FPSKYFERRSEISVPDNPQLSIADPLEHQSPRLDHLPVPLVSLGSREPADHQHGRPITRNRTQPAEARPLAEVDSPVCRLPETWIALEESLPCMVAIGEDQVHLLQKEVGDRIVFAPRFNSMEKENDA